MHQVIIRRPKRLSGANLLNFSLVSSGFRVYLSASVSNISESLGKISFNQLFNDSYTSTHKIHFGSEFNPVFSDFAKDMSLLQNAGAKLM